MKSGSVLLITTTAPNWYRSGGLNQCVVVLAMVDLQLMPAIFGMLVALSVLWNAIQALDPLIPVLKRKADDHPLLVTVKPYLALLTVGVVFWMVAQPVPWWQVLWALGLVTIFLGMDLLFPLLDTKTKGYSEKLRHYQERPTEWKYPIRDMLRSNSIYYRTSVFLVLAILLSAAAGYGRGRRQRDFFVTNVTPETIVLRIYGNRAVAAEFVRAEKRIKPVYKFLRLDEPGLTLQLERVGPITFTEGTQ